MSCRYSDREGYCELFCEKFCQPGCDDDGKCTCEDDKYPRDTCNEYEEAR